MPAAWILAGILASGASALRSGCGTAAPTGSSNAAAGAPSASSLASPWPGSPSRNWPATPRPASSWPCSSWRFGLVGGMLLHRTEPAISRETGVLSMLAGGSSVMPALARDLGADYRYVALSQYLRLLAVSMTLPLVTALFATPGR
ncbi:AbrB family transcriptional regulator [Corynebacterium suedekumii]|nr:AbrB family transcriptional regulator [Corynebacterium suedekumii]